MVTLLKWGRLDDVCGRQMWPLEDAASEMRQLSIDFAIKKKKKIILIFYIIIYISDLCIYLAGMTLAHFQTQTHVIIINNNNNWYWVELQIQIKLRWALFVTYTLIQSIMRSEMCSLHLTHPSGAVGSRLCGDRGAVGGVRCRAQGSHLSRGHFLPEPGFKPTTLFYKSNALSTRPRLPRYWARLPQLLGIFHVMEDLCFVVVQDFYIL